MDQNTGYVKAIVGGRGKKNVNLSLNRATDSTRQPGSTFKVLSAYDLQLTQWAILFQLLLLMSHIDMQMVVQLITGTVVIVEQ